MLLVLEHLAEAGPVVLVIEDMHWADRSTRDLLAFLIRNQGSLDGVLIVATYRSDDLHRTHPLRPLLAELDRVDWVTRMDLARLTRQDTGQLVAQITGREPGDDLLAAVYRRGRRRLRRLRLRGAGRAGLRRAPRGRRHPDALGAHDGRPHRPRHPPGRVSRRLTTLLIRPGPAPWSR